MIVSHADRKGIDDIMAEMEKQTHKPDEYLVVGCCMDIIMDKELVNRVDNETFWLIDASHFNDWGHESRSHGLNHATKDFVMFAACDDSYDPEFIEKLLAEEVDLAYCDWDERGRIQESYPSLGTVTSGNFIVRTKIAQKVGWNHREYIADGKFIMEVMEHPGLTYAHIPEVLYTHR